MRGEERESKKKGDSSGDVARLQKRKVMSADEGPRRHVVSPSVCPAINFLGYSYDSFSHFKRRTDKQIQQKDASSSLRRRRRCTLNGCTDLTAATG